jgi:hypothetical protein
MRESYAKLRTEIKEIEDICKKKLFEEEDIESMDPEATFLMIKMFNLLRYSDQFTLKLIDAIEKIDDIDKKLDRLLIK